MADIQIRVPATEQELEQAQIAKNEAWAFLNPDRPTSIRPAYEAYKTGFLTAFVDGEGAGNFILIRLNYDIAKPSGKTWDQLCLNNIVEDGDTLYGAGLSFFCVS